MTRKDESFVFTRLEDQIEWNLLRQRRLMINSSIDGDTFHQIARKLWYLEEQDPKAPITLIINSPGGSVDAGFAIWDQFKASPCPIRTVVTGMAASMGSVLSLVSGKGHRFAFPNSRIMIHQPLISGWVQGQASDLEITATEIEKTKAKLVSLYVAATGKSKEAIENALDRDYWLSADEALKFGLLDKVITSYDELK